MNFTQTDYENLLENKENYEKSTYGIGEMTTVVYDKNGNVLATRIIDGDNTEYFKGELNV